MVYVNEPYLVLSWEGDHVKAVWRGFFSGEKFRQGLEKILELIKEKVATLYIADISSAKVISLDDQNWISQDWSPRAYEAGLRKNAFIYPKDVFAQMAVRRVTQIMRTEIEIAYFHDEAEAIKWLNQK
jgi:hypothetical protein